MSIRELPSGRFQARPSVGGVRVTETFDTKTEARNWIAEQRADAARGTWIDPRDAKVTLEEWCRAWINAQSHLTENGRASYDYQIESNIVPHLGRYQLGQLSTLRVRQWVADLSDGLSPKTVQMALVLLRQIMNAAVEDRMMGRNPAASVSGPTVRNEKDMVLLTKEQVETLAEACEAEAAGSGLVVLFLAYTGLRWGEMSGLRVSDLDLLRREVHVTKQQNSETTKTGKARVVPLTKRLVDLLAKHLEGKGRDDYVFTTSTGAHLDDGNFRNRVMTPAREAAGLGDRLTPHDLRHTCASWLVEVTDVKTAAEVLGHASVSTTMRYLHTSPERTRSAVDRLQSGHELGTPKTESAENG